MKAHYFLFNAGTAPVVPFVPTIAKQLGFSSVVVGTIYTILPIMGMIAKPTMGAIADRFHCQKLLFLGFMLLTVISFFSILFIPHVNTEIKSQVHCSDISLVRVCTSSDQTSQCAVEHITTEASKNTLFFCQMFCEADASFIQSVCTTWQSPQFCNHSIISTSGNRLFTIVKKGGTEVVESYVNKSRMPKLLPQLLYFDAQLLPGHTTQGIGQEKNCFFIRLGHIRIDGSDWHVPYCNHPLQIADCQMQCYSEALNEVSEISDSKLVSLPEFWTFTALLILSWIGMAVVVSIGDAICFGLLGEYPSRYGHQRLWGSVGWGLFSILSGWLVDEWSQGHAQKNYTPVFYLMAVLLLLDTLISSRLKYNQTARTSSILRDVTHLFGDVRIIVFMTWCILVGMCTALTWNFLFWYLEDLADVNGCQGKDWIKTLEGLIMGIQCFGGELPFFFLSGWILKKIGHINAMSLVLFAFGIRFLLYSMLTDPWWCLPVELLNGLTFGIFYATMASYASIVAPPGTETTIQGLVGAIFEGVGVSLGSLIGGFLFSVFNGSTVFRMYGLAALLFCVLHITLQFFLVHKDVLSTVDSKDFNRARYASPNEAVHMLDDQQELVPSST